MFRGSVVPQHRRTGPGPWGVLPRRSEVVPACHVTASTRKCDILRHPVTSAKPVAGSLGRGPGRPAAWLWRSAAQRHDATGPGPAPSPGAPGVPGSAPAPAARPIPRPTTLDGGRAPCRQRQPDWQRTSGATWPPLIAAHNPCTLIAPVSGRHSRRTRSDPRHAEGPPGSCRDGDPSPDRHGAAPSTMSVRYSRPDPARLPGTRPWTAGGDGV
jgi:hypothetical protein